MEPGGGRRWSRTSQRQPTCSWRPRPCSKQITGFRLHRGALATFQRPPGEPADRVLRGTRTAVLLEDLVDPHQRGAGSGRPQAWELTRSS